MWGAPPSVAARRAAAQFAAARCAVPMATLAAVALVWTRLLPLSQSLSESEAFGVEHYVDHGPASIFGGYGPGNHGLFTVLTWFSTTVTRDFTTPAYRVWSVVPALAAAAVLSWWLWRRLDRWVAVTFTVLAVAAPPYLLLGTRAGGYGLAFLAAALMVIATDSLLQRRTPGQLQLLTASATVGIWSMPVFALAAVPCIGLLLIRPPLRKDAVQVASMVAGAALLFYLPVLGAVWHAAGQDFGPRLPWYGAVWRPLEELVGPVLGVLVPGLSATLAGAIGGALVAAGVFVLWRRPERGLALVLGWPALFGYLVLEVGRFQAATYSLGFLELPLLVLCAVPIVAAGRALLRARLPGALILGGAAGLLLFALARADVWSQGLGAGTRWTPGFATQAPAQNLSGAAALVNATGIRRVLTGGDDLAGLDHYLRTGAAQAPPTAALAGTLCSGSSASAYVQQGPLPRAAASCLQQRQAISIQVPSAGVPITVWFMTDRRSS